MGSNMRLLSLAAALAVAGCSVKEAPKETAADSAAAPTAAPANEVTITATDYAFDAPAEIPAGLTTLRLVDNGKELHHATLIKLDQGKTFDDLVAGIRTMKPGQQPPGWVIMAGGPNAVAPGEATELTTVLEPGNYALVCFIPDAKGVPHVAHGMAKALTVVSNQNAGTAEPAADINVTLSDYKFDFSKPLTAGKHTLKIETAAGQQPHEFTFFQLMPGKTAADLIKYVETGMAGPPPAKPIGGVAGVAAGRASFYEVDLTPGEYAIVCFLEDAKDGKPHFVHGMVQQIKVS
jgi:uncharacterized cupredoxin-like copper-binding protein